MITNYATLQTTVADWLNRSDLSNIIPTFIQMAEGTLRRDERTRRLQERAFTVSADNVSMPGDYASIESLYHDGPTYWGPIHIVTPDSLASIKQQHGESGVPLAAAVIGDRMRFAPVPTSSFALKLLYWLRIDPLSDDNTTNWLLDEAPDIYLYATLVEASPYLKDDPRVPTWESQLEKRLEELNKATQRAQYSGTMVIRPRAVIGG